MNLISYIKQGVQNLQSKIKWTIVKKSSIFFKELYIKKLKGIVKEQKVKIHELEEQIKTMTTNERTTTFKRRRF